MLSHSRINVFAGIALLTAATASFAANPLSIPSNDPKAIVAGNRSIFMNGVDISSSRNQDLRGVRVRISENGDIFITAPQYQVTEEETYTPLSSYTSGQSRPTHQPPTAMGEAGAPATAVPAGAPPPAAAPAPAAAKPATPPAAGATGN